MGQVIKVALTGASGRVGRVLTEALLGDERFHVVGAVDRVGVGQQIRSGKNNITIEPDLEGIFSRFRPQVMVDFTSAEAARANFRLALAYRVRPVVGTTGFTLADLDEFHSLCETQQIGAIVAPNFAIGAILMMHFASLAARYFNSVEIIELHHDGKKDAPSGTALKTAEIIAHAQAREEGAPNGRESESTPGCRGGCFQGIPIHSVRLPGLVAHQEVIFGGTGQTLSIRHDTTSREAFVPGVVMAIQKVMEINRFVYGLEELMEL